MVGIPVVASDVEAYNGFVKDGRDRLPCQGPGPVARGLGKLIEDRDLREKMGCAGERVGAHAVSSGTTLELWIEAYGYSLRMRMAPLQRSNRRSCVHYTRGV